MPFPTNADVPPEVRERHTGHCLTVWRETWNDTFERHGDEGRAFATAELAAQQCEAAKMSTPTAVKFVDGSDSIIEGLAIPYGGPAYLGGKDFDKQKFEPDTDYHFEWFPNEGRPFLFHHGLDAEIKAAVVGRQIERTPMDVGQWVKVQLDKRSKYLEHIQRLVEAGGMSFSSGAVPHLVEVADDGTIKSWPWVELSGTPTPANPDAVAYAVKSADAIEHLAAVRVAVPSAIKEAIDESLDASLAGLSYADHADRVLADMKALVGRSQEIAELRAKAKRGLGSATRTRLAAVREEAQQVIADLDALLVDHEDEARKAASAEYARFLREEARQLGVPLS